MQPCRRRFLRLAGAAAGLPLAARMTAAFVKSDPISDADQSTLLKHFDKELSPLFEQIARLKPTRVIGTSGTLENLATLCSPDDTSSSANGSHKPRVIVLNEKNEIVRYEAGAMPELKVV